VITWPDLVIGAIALLFALKGWKRGFVAEIGGFIALAAAIWAALHYPGTFDQAARDYGHVNAGSAHVVGMVAFALIVYVALLVISGVLSRLAKLPVIGLGNGLGGAAVGIVKALIGTWAVLYVALFFPLPSDLRTDLHNSQLVALVTSENPQIDGIVKATMPWFVRPLVQPLFARHRV
jgi:membrane protein required for colicin V production